MSRHFHSPIALALMLLSATHAGAQELPASRAVYDPAITFPDIKHATRPQGAFLPLQNVLLITKGMKKSQIYTLLDVPHFHEGLFGERKWDYILHFYTGQGDEYRTCQYQLRFDKHARVSGMWWRDAACADLQGTKAVAAENSNEPAVSPQPVPEKPLKSYDFTFDTDSVAISPAGTEVIQLAAGELTSGNYRRAVVTGFTDTVGSVAYNDALAARRGAAVVEDLTALLRRRRSPLAGQVFSRGGRDLAVQTRDEVGEVQNRHVRIELY